MSTKRSYASAQKRFLSFCTRAKLGPLLMSEDILSRYVVFLAKGGATHSTIKSYLSVVSQIQIARGMPHPFQASMARLEQVMKGIKVRQGSRHVNPGSFQSPPPFYIR